NTCFAKSIPIHVIVILSSRCLIAKIFSLAHYDAVEWEESIPLDYLLAFEFTEAGKCYGLEDSKI
ncbi:MAG: hypothetical protein KDF59_11770, partial [Nitrosomonas sp.]|nr:hypothetical protein [Nitrosomonas sp.]